jgi:methylglutaconyl-CoA hydratase
VSDPVRVERAGPGGTVAWVTIARPERRNAFDAATIDALLAAFEALGREDGRSLRALVLAGDGPVFCAGADTSWMREAATLPRAEGVLDAGRLSALLAAVDRCPVPVIARVQGAALGGGAGLCAVADIVVADAAARFGFPEVRIGLVPATIAPFVVRRIGAGHARALFLTGARIDAAEARRIGLVHEVVDGTEALDAAVDELIAQVLAGAPGATRAAKALVADVVGWAGADADALAASVAELLVDVRTSPEAAEGLAAFDERRPPAWASEPE